MKYRIVSESKRLDFIPELVAMDLKALMNYEPLIYTLMDNGTSCDNEPYSGGYWEFRVYENGAKAMVLDEDRRFEVQRMCDGAEGNMSAEALSLACNIMACSMLCGVVTDKAQESLANNYHLLRDAIDGNADAGEIFRFID